MADPVKGGRKAPTAPAAAQNPADAAQAEYKALADRQAQMVLRAPRKNQPTVVIPGGQRRDATPLMRSRYALNNNNSMLSNPESILTEEWLRDHPGWHYEWPVADSNETRAYIKSQWFTIVPPEAIRSDNPFAMVGDLLTPFGNAVCWMRHILVAVPADKHYQRHVAPAEYGLARTAQQEQAVAEDLNAQFGGGGYEAEVEAFTKQSQEQIMWPKGD